MADSSSKADWEFGQALIELDYASLDQIRAGIAVLDRTAGKTLREVLVENGTITREQADAADRRLAGSKNLPEIPGYRLHQQVGAGGMGIVYRATQLSLNRTVAVKVLAPRVSKDPKYVERFLREARAVAKLQHPNLVSGIDVGEAKETYYFVMEYVEGRTLRRRLDAEGPVPEAEALRIALHVAKGLDHAHRHKIVHGDVKPGNIMIMADGLARLCDLGIAREMRKGEENTSFGSRHYVAPEQARAEAVDGRADVYSLGITLGQMLTGRVPPPLAQIPGKTGDLVRRMAEPDREKRVPSALEAIREIEALLAAPKPAAKAPVASRRFVRRTSSSLLAPGIAIAIVAAFGVWWFGLREKPAPQEAGGREEGPRKEETSPGDRAAENELREIGLAQDLDREFEHAGAILKRYRDYRAKHKGKAWEGRASKDEAAYRRRLEDAARAAYDDLRRLEEGPRSEGRLGQVLRFYLAYPPKFLAVTETGETVRSEIARLRRRILEQFTTDKAAIEGLLQSGRADEAVSRLEAMDAYLGDEHRAEFAALRERVLQSRDARAEALRREVAQKYAALDGPFRRAMKLRDFRAGAAMVLRFVEGEWTDDQKSVVRAPGVDYTVLRGLFDGWQVGEIARLCECDPENPATVTPAEAILLDLRAAALLELLVRDAEAGFEHAVEAGEREKYAMASYEDRSGFFAKRDGRVWFYDGDRRHPVEVRRLAAEADLVTLAARGLDRDRAKSERAFEGSARHQASAALLHHFTGAPLKARAHFEKALKLGARGVRLYLASLSATEDTRRREELTKLWERARDHYARRRLAEARADLLELVRNADHPLVRSWRGDIDSLLAKVDADLSYAEKLGVDLRGRVTLLEKGEARVVYDFSDRRQLEAFEVLQIRKGSNWRIEDGGLVSYGQAAAIRWRTRVEGDVAVEFGLRAIEEPQNVLAELYFDPEKRRHYAVTFGFDWVGREQGDRENAVEDNWGMPRTCVIKYPVGVDISQWERAAQWEIWKSRLVGKRVSDARPVRGKRHVVRIERRGKSIRVALDGAAVWEGEDAEYTSGGIAFFADSKTRIDELAVTFTPR